MPQVEATTPMSDDARSARRPPKSRDLLTVREAAAHLTVDASTVKRWIHKGAMQAYKVGPHNLLRITPAELAKHVRPYESEE